MITTQIGDNIHNKKAQPTSHILISYTQHYAKLHIYVPSTCALYEQ